MSIEVGDENVNLCFEFASALKTNVKTVEYSKCYRARIIATVAKLPGYFEFSGFQSIAYTDPDAIITEDQMKYMIKDAISSDPSLFPGLKPDNVKLMYQRLILKFK
jgi:hypothetical protein